MRSFEEGYVYRLCTEGDWAASKASGTLAWNAADERDGFLHLSGPKQVVETAQRHYGEELGLLALAIPQSEVEDELKVERNEDGVSFPHYYGQVPVGTVDHLLRLTRGMAGSYMVVAELQP